MWRLAAVLGVVLLSAVGASLAQESSEEAVVDAPPAAAIYRPAFESRMDGRAAARSVPSRILERGASGVAHLCCQPRADRSLDCNVAFEWPERGGFGAAALRFAEGFQLTQQSYEEFQSAPGRVVHLPIEYRMLPVRDEVAAALEGIQARAENLCAPTSGPLEPVVISAERIGRSR